MGGIHGRLVRLSGVMVGVIELIVVVLVGVLTVLTIYVTIRDILVLLENPASTGIQVLVTDIFTIIIYAEIIRSMSILSGKLGKSMLSSLAEIGFIVAVREALLTALTGKPMDLLVSSLSLLVATVVVYIVEDRLQGGA